MGLITLWPDDVYRPLYYLDNPEPYISLTRFMISMMGAHLEGLLNQLIGSENNLPLGAKIHFLVSKNKISEDLSFQLFEFNNTYIRAKHPSAEG